jgi:HK97 family phage portal protein
MGILASFDRQIRNASYNDTEGWFANWLRGGEDSDSGVSVSEANAMKMATVWKCVNWRAKMFGMLPKKIKERVDILGRSAEREARTHPLYSLIHTAPNPTITSTAWFSLISADVHLYGNSYAYKERFPKSARLAALWRILPDMVRIEVDNATQQIWYFVSYGNGQEQKFFADEILHIRGLGFDGIRGYSPIQMQKQTLGWVKATRQFSAKFYKNAFRPSGLLISPTSMKDQAKRSLIDNLKAQGKEGGLALIEGALEYKPLGIPQDDAQFIETMEFQDDDICGIMEVKPHKVGIMRNMTNNNVEQQNIEAVTDCIQPFAVMVEQWMDLQLLSDMPSTGRGGGTERDRFFIECELKSLLRGDTAAQTAHIEKMIDKGVYSDNDARDYLGLSPYVGGDRYWMNAAYQPIDRVDELIDKKVEPAPAPAIPDATSAPPANHDSVKILMSGFFRDALGRLLNRPAKDREKSLPTIFRPVLIGTSAALEKPVTETVITGRMSFIEDYLGAMAKRSIVWTNEHLKNIATEEVDRAITAMSDRSYP